METLTRWKKVLPHLLAAFLVFHVTAMLVEFIPDVRMGLDRKQWREPRVRHELERWANRLGVPRDDLEEFAFGAGTFIHESRSALRAPFRPYTKATGQKQAWAMFVAGSRFRDRFQIRTRTCVVSDSSCDWQVLYFRGDPEHAWMKTTLENARVRSATFRWGWPQGKKSYTRGCQALAWRAFTEFPELQVVECRFEQTASPDPRREVSSEATFSRERLLLRKNVLP